MSWVSLLATKEVVSWLLESIFVPTFPSNKKQSISFQFEPWISIGGFFCALVVWLVIQSVSQSIGWLVGQLAGRSVVQYVGWSYGT